MTDQKKFRLVGIGASAGGLKAINAFFDHIPDKLGMSYVVVQHLSPNFKSMMDELLTRHTNMPIKVITGATPIQPDHIYLISSNSNIVVEDGIIRQKKRDTEAIPNLPIDLFFHSLGKSFKEKSIGIILSGTGTDGSRGIKTIKENGGLVFVQDPELAQFDGMPNSSIAMNIADDVLSAKDIAMKMVNISKKTSLTSTHLINLDETNDYSYYQKVLIRIEKFTKVNFQEYRRSTLVRRIEKRMYLNHITNLEEYYKFMIDHEQEVHLLYKEFLIGVTKFFRDKDAFEILNRKVIPNLFLLKKPHQQIRIWCTGCSTGEEAYSIAFLIKEYITNNNLSHTFKIFATDLDEEAVNFGSKGSYHNNITADVPDKILNKYFVNTGVNYQIVDDIKEHITFTSHDALSAPPFINIDLVTCRNMMIYLNPSIQKNLLTNFQFSLNFLGYLFLGPSESLGAVKDAFSPVNSKWNIYKKIVEQKPLPHSKNQTEKFLYKTNTINPIKTNNVFRKTSTLQENFFAKAMADRHAPRSLFVNADFEIIYINGAFDDILKFPQSFAKMNLLELVEGDILLFKTGIRKSLQSTKPSFYKNVVLSNKNRSFNLDIRFQQFEDNKADEKLVWIEFFIKNEENGKEENDQRIGYADYNNERLVTLEYELKEISREKQSLVEQIETANEELQSSNEELMAANEELQSTNEELQSVNEELYTVNTELQTKVNELVITNNDINNLLESTEIGTIFLDSELKIRRFTPALREQFKLEKSDIGRNITNFTNTFNDVSVYRDIEEVLNNNKLVEREISDQAGNIYLMRILAYRTNMGKVDGVIITFVNINELKKAQFEHEQSAQSYRAILENSEDLVMSLSIDGIIMDINFDKLLKKKKEQAIGTDARELILPEFKDLFDFAFNQIVTEKKRYQNIEVALNLKNAEKRWLNMTLTPIIIEDEIKHVVATTRDITKYKKLGNDLKNLSFKLEQEVTNRNRELISTNRELEEINGYLDSFVHGAAHDLRSPVMHMKGMINFFPKIKSMKKKEDMIAQFSQSVSHMEDTINGLIEMIEFQKNTDLLVTEIDLKKAFEEVQLQLSIELNNIDAKVVTSFVQKPKIRYIKAFITSIFYNLLSNSIKYRSYDRPLEIKVHITKKDIYTVISVTDNGIGIDLERYGHFLFKPFKRLTVERNGTGIGLSIINNVVKKNGGRIDVTSNINKGATFSVYLVSYPDINTSTPPMINNNHEEQI